MQKKNIMAAQEFRIYKTYIGTKENIAFGLSAVFIGLLSAFLFAGQGSFLLQSILAVSFTLAVLACNVVLLNKIPAGGRQESLSRRIKSHSLRSGAFALFAAIVYGFTAVGLLQVSFLQVLKFTAFTGFMAVLTAAAYAAIYFVRVWQDNILFAHALKLEIMDTQLESIRQQLSPHFFFNSLNSLTLVIEEDPEEAVKYVHHIAHMYRYLLQSKEAKTVPLQHELRFAESYIYLQKMRFGKALDMTIAIDKAEMNATLIPPLTLYILLENVLKHNIITKAKPLHINVFIRDGKLQVCNNIQSRYLPDENPVIGLKTVRSSYESVSYQPMEVIQDDNNFTVVLPLIKELSQTA